ncbi:MAG: hypothetical protein K2I61_02305 [Muribaculaceae bacterium]|nr:hypothetical protein [Muribaculaceae bacterium]
MAAIILACLLPISCGHNSRQSAGDESAGFEETDVAESDSKGGLMPMPVYSIHGLQFALMNRDTGELVQFDNDEDYSGYCTFLRFVKNCDAAPYEYEEVFGIDKTFFYEDFKQNHKVSDTVYNFHLSLINAVIDYLDGNKDKIKDRKLFKRIDKAFFDYHPDQGYYSLEYSYYDSKRYSSTNNRMLSVSVKSQSDDNPYIYYHDGTALPEGSLVFMLY